MLNIVSPENLGSAIYLGPHGHLLLRIFGIIGLVVA